MKSVTVFHSIFSYKLAFNKLSLVRKKEISDQQ